MNPSVSARGFGQNQSAFNQFKFPRSTSTSQSSFAQFQFPRQTTDRGGSVFKNYLQNGNCQAQNKQACSSDNENEESKTQVFSPLLISSRATSEAEFQNLPYTQTQNKSIQEQVDENTGRDTNTVSEEGSEESSATTLSSTNVHFGKLQIKKVESEELKLESPDSIKLKLKDLNSQIENVLSQEQISKQHDQKVLSDRLTILSKLLSRTTNQAVDDLFLPEDQRLKKLPKDYEKFMRKSRIKKLHLLAQKTEVDKKFKSDQKLQNLIELDAIKIEGSLKNLNQKMDEGFGISTPRPEVQGQESKVQLVTQFNKERRQSYMCPTNTSIRRKSTVPPTQISLLRVRNNSIFNSQLMHNEADFGDISSTIFRRLSIISRETVQDSQYTGTTSREQRHSQQNSRLGSSPTSPLKKKKLKLMKFRAKGSLKRMQVRKYQYKSPKRQDFLDTTEQLYLSLIELTIKKAKLLFSQSCTSKSLKLLKALLPLCALATDMRNLIQVYLCIAECNFLREKYAESVVYCKHIIYILEDHNYYDLYSLLSKCLNIKCQCEMQTRQYANALVTLNFLYEQALNLNDKKLEIEVFSKMALCHYYLSDLENCNYYYTRQTRDITEPLGSELRQIYTNLRMNYMLERQKLNQDDIMHGHFTIFQQFVQKFHHVLSLEEMKYYKPLSAPKNPFDQENYEQDQLVKPMLHQLRAIINFRHSLNQVIKEIFSTEDLFKMFGLQSYNQIQLIRQTAYTQRWPLDSDGIIMFPDSFGQLQTYVPNKIKVPELTQELVTSLQKLKFPQPRMLHIEGGGSKKKYSKKTYYTQELKELLPGLYRDDENFKKAKTYFQKRYERIDDSQINESVQDVFKRAIEGKTGQNSVILLSHMNRKSVCKFKNDREKEKYYTSHFDEWAHDVEQQKKKREKETETKDYENMKTWIIESDGMQTLMFGQDFLNIVQNHEKMEKQRLNKDLETISQVEVTSGSQPGKSILRRETKLSKQSKGSSRYLNQNAPDPKTKSFDNRRTRQSTKFEGLE